MPGVTAALRPPPPRKGDDQIERPEREDTELLGLLGLQNLHARSEGGTITSPLWLPQPMIHSVLQEKKSSRIPTESIILYPSPPSRLGTELKE